MIRTFLILWYVLQPALANDDSKFFMLIQRNETHTNVSCVTTEEKSDWGLSWAGIDTRKIETSGFKNPSEDFVQLVVNETNLNVNKTMGFPLPIIMDSRWNGFTVYRGSNMSTVNISGSGINLSLLGPSFTIILNGSLGTLIRVNINGTTLTVNDLSNNSLNRNDFDWSHFQLSWSGQVFKVFNETSNLILTFEHNLDINLNTATFVVDENSTAVLHEYVWYDAKNLTFKAPKNEDCLMLYFAMCDTCVLDLIIKDKTERITSGERKWTTKEVTEFQVISINGTNKKGTKEEYFALDVRKCHSKSKTKAISVLFESLTEIKCYNFYNSENKVISFGSGTKVGLLGTKKFNGIRKKTGPYYYSNSNLIICTDDNKCHVPKEICNSTQKRNIDQKMVQKLDAHVYCQVKDGYTKETPVKVSVKWKTAEMSNYFFKFCEDQNPHMCYELPGNGCNISMWENYTCSSLHLKILFEYNLLTYSKDDIYKPIECKNYIINDEGDKVHISVTEITENQTLILKVSNSWKNIVATQLKLTLENDTDQFYSTTEKGQHLIYKLTKARQSTTYKATLHVQADQECTDSKEIEVHTPPAKLIFEKFPTLNCTEQKCTIQLSRSEQASANGSLQFFVIDTSSNTTLNVTVEEMLLKTCYNVYDATKRDWIPYNVPSKVTVHQNRNTNDENTIINFDIQNNVSYYKIEMLLINKYCNKATCTLYSIDTKKYERKSRVNPKPETEGIDSGIIVVLVLFMLLVIASVFVIYKKKLWRRFPNYVNIHRNSGFRSSAKPRSKLVQVEELEEYVKKNIKAPRGDEDELSYQFKLFPSGQTHSWEYGKLPANSKKQRYKNIIAYDHSRVVLTKLPGDDFSDYINANYVGDRMYIATQGPKKNTTNDFWRMVWEQNSPVIIMLTKFVENDKPKCVKYWPDESETYGEITVSLTSEQYQADYCCRTFNLCKGTVNKRVTHLHYELWPDHGVPDCQSLASFIATIPPLKTTGPQIVHCSAGCGRTGTLILVQMCLRNARQTGQVDFLHSLTTIRKCRIDLVQNEEQYKVTHLLVLEILFKEDYTVICDGRLKFAIANRKVEAAQQLCYLNNVCWRDTALYQTVVEGEIIKENDGKNRFSLIIPSQCSAVVIPRDPITDTHSDYINAVLIKKFYDSIANQNFDEVEADYGNTVRLYSSAEYIVTQQPLPKTIKDFWRMVLDKDVDIIVSLNKINVQDQSSCVFWPQSGQEINPTSTCKLRFIQRLSDNEGYDVVTLHAESKGNLARPILMISMKNWNAGESTPESRSHLLELVKYVQALSTGQISSDHPIIVTCHDGATASGLFLSLITTLEMVRIENKFDLCRVVRSIRQSRKEFMRKIEQFGFLYDVIMDYLHNHPHEQQVIYSNEEALYANWNVM